MAEENKIDLSLGTLLAKEYEKQIHEIRKKSEALGRKEQELIEKEKELNALSDALRRQENGNHAIERALHELEYLIHYDVVGSGHCKSAYVKVMGQSFWEKHLQNALKAGAKIGKSEHQVKQELSYAMVSIYMDLEQWDKAYDFLVEQATGYAWLSLWNTQIIVRHVGCCERLKTAVYARLAKYDLDPSNRQEFENIKNWLVFDYGK